MLLKSALIMKHLAFTFMHSLPAIMARNKLYLLETYKLIQKDYAKWEKKTIPGTKKPYTREQIIGIIAPKHRYAERTIEDILQKDLEMMAKELEEVKNTNQLAIDFK